MRNVILPRLLTLYGAEQLFAFRASMGAAPEGVVSIEITSREKPAIRNSRMKYININAV
jgi:hypothetical protein